MARLPSIRTLYGEAPFPDSEPITEEEIARLRQALYGEAEAAPSVPAIENIGYGEPDVISSHRYTPAELTPPDYNPLEPIEPHGDAVFRNMPPLTFPRSPQEALERGIGGGEAALGLFGEAEKRLGETRVGRAFRAVSEPFAGETTRQAYQQALDDLSMAPSTPKVEEAKAELRRKIARTAQEIYEEEPLPVFTGLPQEIMNPLTYFPGTPLPPLRKGLVAGVRGAGRGFEAIAQATKDLPIGQGIKDVAPRRYPGGVEAAKAQIRLLEDGLERVKTEPGLIPPDRIKEIQEREIPWLLDYIRQEETSTIRYPDLSLRGRQAGAAPVEAGGTGRVGERALKESPLDDLRYKLEHDLDTALQNADEDAYNDIAERIEALDKTEAGLADVIPGAQGPAITRDFVLANPLRKYLDLLPNSGPTKGKFGETASQATFQRLKGNKPSPDQVVQKGINKGRVDWAYITDEFAQEAGYNNPEEFQRALEQLWRDSHEAGVSTINIPKRGVPLIPKGTVLPPETKRGILTPQHRVPTVQQGALEGPPVETFATEHALAGITEEQGALFDKGLLPGQPSAARTRALGQGQADLFGEQPAAQFEVETSLTRPMPAVEAVVPRTEPQPLPEAEALPAIPSSSSASAPQPLGEATPRLTPEERRTAGVIQGTETPSLPRPLEDAGQPPGELPPIPSESSGGIRHAFPKTFAESPTGQSTPFGQWLKDNLGQFTYPTRRNTEEGMKEAQALIAAEGDVNKSGIRLAQTAHWTDVEGFQAMEVLRLLALSDQESAQLFLNVIDPQALAGGRFIQAFSAQKRLSPEAQLMAAVSTWRAAVEEGGVSIRTMAKNIKAVGKGIVENTTQAGIRRSKAKVQDMGDQVADINEQIGQITAGAPRSETKADKVRRNRLSMALSFLENEGRNPAAPRKEADELTKILNPLKRLANEAGWVLPHDEAQWLIRLAEDIQTLPKGERFNAMLEVAQDLRDTYMPALETASAQYRESQDLITLTKRSIAFLDNWGRNPKVIGLNPDEVAALNKMRSLANAVGYVLPPDMAQRFNDAVQAANALPIGPTRTRVIKNIIADIVGEVGPELMSATRQLRTAPSIVPKRPQGPLMEALQAVADERTVQLARLRKEAGDLQYLMDAETRVVQPRILNEGTQRIATLKRLTKVSGTELPEPIALSFIDRGRIVNELMDAAPGTAEAVERARMSISLANDIARIIPPSHWQEFMAVAGIPRQVMVSFDISMPMRQAVFAVGNKAWRAAWQPMLRALFSEEYALEMAASIKASPMYPRLEKANLFFSEIGGGVTKGEEGFTLNTLGGGGIASKATGAIQMLTRPSERNAVTFLNKVRSGMFEDIVGRIEGWGKVLTEQDDKDIAQYINWATGRGSIGDINRSEFGNWLVSQTFFSARTWASRLEYPLAGLKAYLSLVPGAQKLPGHVAYSRPVATALAYEFAKSMSLIGGVIGIGAAAGLVSNNPLDVDFAKVKIGPMRIDFTGGEQTNLRYLFQIAAGQRVTGSGKTVPADRGELLLRLIRSKLAPWPGWGTTALTGRDYRGQTTNALDAAVQLVTPMVWNDLKAAYDLMGPVGAAAAGGMALTGIGVNTYEDIEDMRRRVSAHMYPGEDFDTAVATDRAKMRAVDSNETIQQVFKEIGAGQEYKPAETLKYAGKLYEDRTALLQKDFAATYPTLLTGKARREYIQSFKSKMSDAYHSTLGAEIGQQAKGPERDRSLRDHYAKLYWEQDAGIDPRTGGPDYREIDTKRQRVLDAARDAGVNITYITEKGADKFRDETYTDPVLRQAIKEYDKAQTVLRPYWNAGEWVLNLHPAWRGIVEGLQLLPPNDEIRASLERRIEWRAYSRAVALHHLQLRDLNRDTIDKALHDWYDYDWVKAPKLEVSSGIRGVQGVRGVAGVR